MRRSKYAVTVANERNEERIVYPMATSASDARNKVQEQIDSKGSKFRISLVRPV